MRDAQIQSAGLPMWLHFVMMLINICGSLVWNLLCYSSGISNFEVVQRFFGKIAQPSFICYSSNWWCLIFV